MTTLEERMRRAAALTGRERRTVTSKLEVRAAATGGSTVTVEGYASVYEQPYDMGWYTEVVRMGAGAATLAASPDCRGLVNHAGIPFGRTRSGTLELSEDTTGLHWRVAELDAAAWPELASALERGDLDECSFGFYITGQTWSPDYEERAITSYDLDGGDISLVTYPANPATSASVVRSADVLAALDGLTGDDLAAIRHRLDAIAAAELAAAPASGLDAGSVRRRMIALGLVSL